MIGWGICIRDQPGLSPLPPTNPAFDYQAELDTSVRMWREEYQSFGEKGYNRE